MIATNQILVPTLILGIIVVPLTIAWLDDEAFGLIALLGANIGLASIFRQIIQQSLTRELGSAYHASDEVFRRNYRAICLISFICALLSILTFAIVIVLIPLLQIPEQYLNGAIWLVVGQCVSTVAMVILAPMLNMYLVMERFIGYNIWFIGVRATNIISVLILGYVIGIDDPARGLMMHGVLWSALGVLGFIIAAAYIYTQDHRLAIKVKGVRREALRDVFGTFSWNSAVQVAMNLHEQIPPLLLNIFVGPLANAAWGIGFRFVAYIRMATTGIQFGSDAVSARLASGEDSEQSRKQLQKLLNVQTRLTTLIALPIGLVVFFYSWPIFHIWVGGSLKQYEQVMPTAVIITRVVAWAIAARAISDTWMIVLYGAGFIRSYAKWVIAGGIIAPVGSLVLMKMLPEVYLPIAPPAMMTGTFVFLHLLAFPFITAKCLHISPTKLLLSLTRPFIVSMLAMGCAVLVLSTGAGMGDLGFGVEITRERASEIDATRILASLAVFGVMYAILSLCFVLTESERARLMSVINRFRRASNPA
jgi:O-antigen/teichoic acid export membrane protein